MAMKSCPECLNQIDEDASVCPHCGHVLAGDEPEQKSVEVYLEERRWTFGNTLIALLLVLLIGGLGYLLYIYGFKLPYEDAVKYYEEEKAAYEQQVQEYQGFADQISEANAGLNAKIDYVRSIVNSGEEPLDPRVASSAAEMVRQAESLRVPVPEITSEELPVPATTSVFRAKDVRETGRMVDQQRFGLYQQYSSLKVPDYSQVIAALDREADALKESIQQKKESDAAAGLTVESQGLSVSVSFRNPGWQKLNPGSFTLNGVSAEIPAEELDRSWGSCQRRYEKNDGRRTRKYEEGFDTKAFYEGVGVQHKYYYIEYMDDIWADNEINYIGIGMYEAWLGNSLFMARELTWGWKIYEYNALCNWYALPTAGTFFWLTYGHSRFRDLYERLDPCTCDYILNGSQDAFGNRQPDAFFFIVK